MKRIHYFLISFMIAAGVFPAAVSGAGFHESGAISASVEEKCSARWIAAASGEADTVNSWMCFRKDITLSRVPEIAVARIAADSKYWLWINGELAVFEGGLKRGEDRCSSYFDELDLAQFLHRGKNSIAVLVWHFGKSGFSHNDSGKAGFILDSPALDLRSDSTWHSCIHPAYSTCDGSLPNYRLAESNIRFDAARDIADWQTSDPSAFRTSDGSRLFGNSEERGGWGDAPWGRMVKRPIPLWKDFDVRKLRFITQTLPGGSLRVEARLPYNMQITPILDITDKTGGSAVSITTDHSIAGGETNIRAEYVTAAGRHSYESLGWMNGEKIILEMPSSVHLNSLSYRQTGYDTEPEGRFICDDEFVSRFWTKALNTLYVNMRDTFFDCPDRERAQWWGDVTVMMGECFYTYSLSVHSLMRKAIRELCLWRSPDGALHSPIPGNYNAELPGQMLAAIGPYGFWNYYLNTGDRETLKFVYPYARDYLSLWTTDSTGLTEFRNGGWNWGDWGDDRDMRLIYAGWHYLALGAAARMADELGKPEDSAQYRELAALVSSAFNLCWNGSAYRHPSYTGDTDDRVQALAVISGIAGQEKYDALYRTFREHENASPYMEKYVMEALCRIGHPEYAFERMKRRFAPMVNDPERSTLFEGWDIGNPKYGGGTTNHAWSGGPLTVIASEICGIRPLKPGFTEFEIAPVLVGEGKKLVTDKLLGNWSISFPTVSGTISVSCRASFGRSMMRITVPQGTSARFVLPDGSVTILPSGKHTIRL